MPSLKIQIKDQVLAATLQQMAARISNKTPLLKIIGEVGVDFTQRTFEDEGYPAGSWKRSIRAQLTGGKTLSDRGQLKGSVTYQVRGGNVSIGTNKIYGSVHQFGATIRPRSAEYLRFKIKGGGWARKKSVTIPARPFLVFRDDMMQSIFRAVGDYATIGGAIKSVKRI